MLTNYIMRNAKDGYEASVEMQKSLIIALRKYVLKRQGNAGKDFKACQRARTRQTDGRTGRGIQHAGGKASRQVGRQ